MIVQCFGIKDTKVGAFSQPFFSPTVAAAIRMLGMTMEDRSTMVSKFPADFALWHLGCFDDQTGLFTVTEPYQICTALDCQLPVPQQKDMFNA